MATMTMKTQYTAIIAAIQAGEFTDDYTAEMAIEFLTDRVAKLEKRKTSEYKPKAETLETRAAVIEAMEDGEQYTAGMLAEALDRKVGAVSAALRYFVKEGKVADITGETDKCKVYTLA